MNISRRMLLASAGAIVASPAYSQEFPTKPIEMIVAFPAGGGTDVGARSIARVMEKMLGGNAKLGVINRHGAGGEVGWTALAQSRPDGYTIGFINAPAIVALTIEKQARFTMDSFEPIGNVVTDPNVLLVHRDSPFRTVADFVEYGKANPGTFTVGSSGAPGNSEHLALLQIQLRTQARYNFAPFSGTAPLKSAILGRHVPAAILSISEVLQEARDGRIRILGTMTEARHRWSPEIPTFREQGIDLVSNPSRGIAAPKGTPEPALKVMREALAKAVADPEYRDLAERSLIPIDYRDAAGQAAMWKQMQTDLAQIWLTTPWR